MFTLPSAPATTAATTSTPTSTLNSTARQAATRLRKAPLHHEHRPCNGRLRRTAQVRKHDVRKAGRQSPPVPPGKRNAANVDVSQLSKVDVVVFVERRTVDVRRHLGDLLRAHRVEHVAHWKSTVARLWEEAAGGSRPQDQRPITVLDVVYRVWAKGIVMAVAPVLHREYLGGAVMRFRPTPCANSGRSSCHRQHHRAGWARSKGICWQPAFHRMKTS